MDKETFEALEKVVLYLWEEELQNFEECNEDERTGHIYESVENLAQFISKNKKAIIAQTK